MSEFHKDVVLVNNYHDGVTVVYKELDDQGTMEVNVYDNSKYPADKYTMKVGRQESMGTLLLLILTSNKLLISHMNIVS